MVIYVEDPETLRKRLTQKRLVLYGMGVLGTAISQWCDAQKIEHLFADRNAVKKQSTVRKQVIPPEVLKRDYKDANVIISTNIYYDEIKKDLLRFGFPQEQILSYRLFVPENVRWEDLEGNIDWNLMRPSVELLSKWIPETVESVADYGAGQMYLKTFLRPGVKYYPIDYIKRFPETIVCDLNTGNFPELHTDVAVLNGVLEFLMIAEELLEYVCSHTEKRIIISYMTVDKFPDQTARRVSGYISDLTESKILSQLNRGGFQLIQQEVDPLDGRDSIYLFERMPLAH